MAPIRDYAALCQQLGAYAPIVLQQRVVPDGGQNCMAKSRLRMGNFYSPKHPMMLLDYSARYMAHTSIPQIHEAGTILAGFSPITVAGHHCYTNGKPKQGTAWFGDGSKLEVPSQEGQVERAGVALSCGPLLIIARVTGPQTSYTGELQGAALVTAPNLAKT